MLVFGNSINSYLLAGFILKGQNMNFKAILLSGILAAVFLFSRPLAALAQEKCESVYGGGEICYKGEVMVDKLVRQRDVDSFVDNLGTDQAFKTQEEIYFRIKVKNTGDYKIDSMYVRDTLPNYLEYVSGPTGDNIENVNYDSGSKVLTFTVRNLGKDESRSYDFKTRVVGEGDLPNGTVCVINHVRAEANGRVDEDTAQVCLTKQVLGVTTLPPTGPNKLGLFALEALGFTIVGALFKKSQGELGLIQSLKKNSLPKKSK